MQDDSDILLAAERWLGEGHRVALATVLSTWGSAPRQAGSMLAIRDDGAFVGSVSNGCVEGTVIETGLASLEDGKIRKLDFGVDDGMAWSAGLTCGGKIAILVEALHDIEILHALNAARAKALPMVRAVHIESGESRLIEPFGDRTPLGAAAHKAALCNTSRLGDDGWFFAVFQPPVDLVLIGAVHTAQALTKMAALMEFETRIIDPRRSFITAERFPGVALFADFPDLVLAKTPLQRHSAVVALAHDPKIDDPALIAALSSEAFYIGALGSQKTQDARRTRLAAAGFSQADLARLHGPVGLTIGSKSPAEIAVSILAEITKTLRLPDSQ